MNACVPGRREKENLRRPRGLDRVLPPQDRSKLSGKDVRLGRECCRQRRAAAVGVLGLEKREAVVVVGQGLGRGLRGPARRGLRTINVGDSAVVPLHWIIVKAVFIS